MRATFGALAALLFVLLPACSHHPKPAASARHRAQITTPIDEQNIPMLQKKSVRRPVKLLGFIDTDAGSDQAKAMASLRHKAAALGADAILNVELKSDGSAPHYSAIAVKYGKRNAAEKK